MNTGHMGSETSPNSDSLASDIILHGHINQSPVLEPKRQHTVNRVQYSNSFLNDNPGTAQIFLLNLLQFMPLNYSYLNSDILEAW